MHEMDWSSLNSSACYTGCHGEKGMGVKRVENKFTYIFICIFRWNEVIGGGCNTLGRTTTTL